MTSDIVISSLTLQDPQWEATIDWFKQAYLTAVSEELSHSPASQLRRVDATKSDDINLALGELLQTQDQACLLIAKQADQFKGYFLGMIKDCLAEDPACVGYINGVYVIPELRHQGLGQRLLDEGVKWFKEQHIGLVELYTAIGNEAAKKFWQKNGYVAVEEVFLASL